MKKTSEASKINSANVLEFIYRKKETSRIEISKETNLTPAAVTPIVGQLIEDQRLIETGDEVRGGKGSGRNRKILKLNDDYAYLLGIEINMKGIFYVLTNLTGKIIHQTMSRPEEFAIEKINEEITSHIQTILYLFPKNKVLGIGIAIPGHYEQNKKEIISNNKRWQHFHLEEITQHFSIPFKVENNIECMALSQYLFEPENSPDNFLFLHVGHGLFCSFFDSDHLEIKENYYIGEIGHTVVNIDGPQCECGKKGCLQTYISDSWLIKNATLLFENSNLTVLRNLVESSDTINLETIINGYTLGDSFLTNQIDLGLIFLGTSIANTLILHDAKKIYINSELLTVEHFQERLTKLIQEQLRFIPTKNDLAIEIVPYNLYRGARGAAALATLSFFIKHPNF